MNKHKEKNQKPSMRPLSLISQHLPLLLQIIRLMQKRPVWFRGNPGKVGSDVKDDPHEDLRVLKKSAATQNVQMLYFPPIVLQQTSKIRNKNKSFFHNALDLLLDLVDLLRN